MLKREEASWAPWNIMHNMDSKKGDAEKAKESENGYKAVHHDSSQGVSAS